MLDQRLVLSIPIRRVCYVTASINAKVLKNNGQVTNSFYSLACREEYNSYTTCCKAANT